MSNRFQRARTISIEFGEAEPEPACFDDQRLREPLLQRRQFGTSYRRIGSGAGRRLAGHHRADAGFDGQQPGFHQQRDDPLRGVRVHLQLLAERANRREPIAWPELSRHHGPRDRVDHLVDDRFAGAQGKREGQHRLVYQSR